MKQQNVCEIGSTLFLVVDSYTSTKISKNLHCQLCKYCHKKIKKNASKGACHNKSTSKKMIKIILLHKL